MVVDVLRKFWIRVIFQRQTKQDWLEDRMFKVKGRVGASIEPRFLF